MFLASLLFLFPSLDSSPSFIVNPITGSEIKTMFGYKRFDQKSGSWKHACLNFIQYPRTGPSQKYQIGMSVSNE